MAPAASNDVQSVLLAIRALGREPVIVQFLQARPSPHSPTADAIVLPVCVRQYKRVPSAAGPRLWRALMLIGFVGPIGYAVVRLRPQT